MKSMEEIYNQATQPKKRSMEEIFNQVSGGVDMNKVMSEVNQTQELPKGLTSGAGDEIAGILTDAPVTLASGAANLLGADQQKVTNPFTGKQIPGAGYDEAGNRLSPYETGKQIGGATVETAANVFAPGAGKGVLEASKYGLKTMLPKLARGFGTGAITGFGQGAGAELRETQDFGEAAKTGAVTALAGGVIGAGASGIASKLSRGASNIVNDLQAAKASNDFAKVAEIEASPEYNNILRVNGYENPEKVNDAINDAVVNVKKTILDEQKTVMSPSKVDIRNGIRDGQYDDAIKEILADYNNYGGNFDDVQRARQAKTKQYQELREKIARELSGTDLDPFKNISAGEMKARVWENLSDTIKRDMVEGPKAQQFISDYLDTQLAKGNSMERLDFLRMSGNQDWQKTSSGAQIQTAIANAARGAMDDIVLALEKSGADSDLVKIIKDYVELNRLYGVSKQAEKLQRELGTAINKKKGINRLTNMLAGVGLGSATGNPFAFYAGAQLSDWGQRALNNTMEAGILRNYASKIAKSSGDKATKEVPDALKRLVGVDKTLKQKKQAEQLLADQEAAKIREMTYTPESQLPTIQMGAGNAPKRIDNTPSIDVEQLIPETPAPKPKASIYEAYTPEAELPVIESGPTPKSKFSKSSKDLPNIAYGAAPITLTNMDLLKASVEPTDENKKSEYSIPGRNVKIKEQDLDELAAIMFGEVSNRSLEKQKLEARTIANIVLNRMEQKPDATATDILTEPNQFQAYKGKEYSKYKSGDAKKNPLNINKLKAVEEVISEIKKGKLKNNIGDAQFYAHMKDNTIRVYDSWEDLKRNVKNVK